MNFSRLILLTVVLLAATSVAIAQLASNYPPVSVDMPLMKLTDDIYYVEGLPGTATEHEGFVSNAGFVVTEAGVVVFDALGSPSLAWPC